MRISLFGLGYVGAVTGACLSHAGNHVVGVDVQEGKVRAFSGGTPPVVEPELDELLRGAVAAGRVTATTDAARAVADTEISVICVGTPSREDGSVDLSRVEAVARTLGETAAKLGREHAVVLRSTCVPGTLENVLEPALAAGGCRVNEPGGVLTAMVPEFLREGSAVRDFREPSVVIIGTRSADMGRTCTRLFTAGEAPVHVVEPAVAEMAKYASNLFHAAKIVFANELGSLCRALEADSHAVMRLLCADTKLNISPAYLKPGFSFGGSCLPKDLRAVLAEGRRLAVETPMLRAIRDSNRLPVERAVSAVLSSGCSKVGLLGLSFKDGTDDLRESPLVELAERLLGKGLDLRIHDAHVRPDRLVGANRAYIDREIPHLSRLLVDDAAALLAHARCLIIGTRAGIQPDQARAFLHGGGRILDLVRVDSQCANLGDGYEGISW